MATKVWIWFVVITHINFRGLFLFLFLFLFFHFLLLSYSTHDSSVDWNWKTLNACIKFEIFRKCVHKLEFYETFVFIACSNTILRFSIAWNPVFSSQCFYFPTAKQNKAKLLNCTLFTCFRRCCVFSFCFFFFFQTTNTKKKKHVKHYAHFVVRNICKNELISFYFHFFFWYTLFELVEIEHNFYFAQKMK